MSLASIALGALVTLLILVTTEIYLFLVAPVNCKLIILHDWLAMHLSVFQNCALGATTLMLLFSDQ